MAIGKMLTSPDIEGRLGEDGVAETAARLWPGGLPDLRAAYSARVPRPCASMTWARSWMATLHHEQYSASGWNRGP